MKWKLVPVEPTPEMQKAGAEVPLNKAARHNVVFRRMLEAAPMPPALTDERILHHLDAILKASGSGLKNYSMHKPIEEMKQALRAIEREILGGGHD